MSEEMCVVCERSWGSHYGDNCSDPGDPKNAKDWRRFTTLPETRIVATGDLAVGDVVVSIDGERFNAGAYRIAAADPQKPGGSRKFTLEDSKGDQIGYLASSIWKYRVFRSNPTSPPIAVQAADPSHYPHRCPSCNSAAYVSPIIGSVDCSRKCGAR